MVAFGPNSPYYIGKMETVVPESVGVEVDHPVVWQKAYTLQCIRLLSSSNNYQIANLLQVRLNNALRQPNGLLVAEQISRVYQEAQAAVAMISND